MKKRGDIKKLLYVAKQGLNLGKVITKVIFLLLISVVHSQVNLNQFFLFDTIESVPGNYKISFIDFDKDGDKDIVFYGNEKEFIIHENEDGGFSESIEKFFFYEISNMELLKNIEGYGDMILFHSRKNMLSGLASFTKYGTLQLLNTHQYNSYPDKITVGDINNDNQNEAIVYGNSFNGISLIEEKNFVIEEKKIIENKIYDFGYMVDLNFDTYNDIVILDIIDNSIKFFLNDEYGKFSEARSYSDSYEINEFYTFNFNNDEFRDFLIISEEKIEIIKGDSVYSFSDKFIVETEKAAQISINDFNKDGFNDLAWLDKKGDLFFSFNDKNDYCSPIKILSGKDLSFLTEVSNNQYRYCVSANEKGKIFLLSNNIARGNNFKFTLGESIKHFELIQNDIVLISDSSYSLVIIENSEEVLFTSLKKISLRNNFNSFLKDYKLNQYLLYNKGVNLIHKVDVESGREVYQDFHFKNNLASILNNDSVYVIISSSTDSVFISKIDDFNDIDNVDFSFSTSDSLLIPTISMVDEGIYFWSFNEEKLFFNSVDINSNFNRTKIELNEFGANQLEIVISGNESGLLSIIEQGNSLTAFVYDGKLEQYDVESNSKYDELRSVPKIIYYDEAFYLYKIDPKVKKIYTTKLIESQDINGYFITSFYKGKDFLVYLNNTDNTINFVKIE